MEKSDWLTSQKHVSNPKSDVRFELNATFYIYLVFFDQNMKIALEISKKVQKLCENDRLVQISSSFAGISWFSFSEFH